MITIRSLEKVFPSNRCPVWAVKGVDLVVEEGQFVVLLGPSGCVKQRGAPNFSVGEYATVVLSPDAWHMYH